jgi:hypothetical protein
MSALTHLSIIHDDLTLNHAWLDDIDIAGDLLDWCELRFGTTSQGAWDWKQYSIGGHRVCEFQFLKASCKMMFDLQFSEVVTIYDSAASFYVSVAAGPPA